MTLLSRRQLLLALASFAVVSADKILSQKHGGHDAIVKELQEEGENIESFTCTITGATGQPQCDAAADDDGSKCVWCVLNSFGFCVSETQAQTFKQAIPTIDCDDDNNTDDDKAPSNDDAPPSPLWECLEAKEESGCDTDKCVWCDTKGGFGVCLTTEGAKMASDSYWFDCKAEFEDDDDEEGDDDAVEEGEDDDEEESSSEDEEWEDIEEGEDDEDFNEFVVDTSCVMSGILLDPNDDEATSEAACFAARDVAGKPCEWCSVAGSPFRLCLSEPQAQVAEYVGAVCTGSDESFEPEDFDDSCIAHQHSDSGLTRTGCWQHMDLDGNGCEWCNLMGVELCLGGVQAELVEHWGATCVMDEEEHGMAQEAIQHHHQFIQAEKEARRQAAAAEKKPETNEAAQSEDEEELDLEAIWLTSDPSCMITSLRTTNGADPELACAQRRDAEGNYCNWCSMGTGFEMCLNEEQTVVAEYMGIECETISMEVHDVLDEHNANVDGMDEEEESEDEDEEEYDDEEDYGIDPDDLDPSCLMSMQAGPDKDTCVATKDQNGDKCEWCTWGTVNACISGKQADIVEPFGVTCDPSDYTAEQFEDALAIKDEFWGCIEHSKDGAAACASTDSCSWCNTAAGVGLCLSSDAADAVYETEFFDCGDDEEDEEAPKEMEFQKGPAVDTSCFISAGKEGAEHKCLAHHDATGHACHWCTLGSLGVHTCMSAEQAKVAHSVGVTCNGHHEEAAKEEKPLLSNLPKDFYSCLSQSSSVDDCDETCTWCDLKSSTTGSGLCLSDDVADAVTHFTGDAIVDCTEPEEPEENKRNIGDVIVEAMDSIQ